MKSTQTISGVIVSGFIIGGVFSYVAQPFYIQNQTEQVLTSSTSDVLEQTEDIEESTDSAHPVGGVEEVFQEEDPVFLAGTAQIPFEEFSYDQYQKALSDDRNIFLHFCSTADPICQVETPDILEAFNLAADKQTFPNLVGFHLDLKDDRVDEDEQFIINLFNVEKQHTKILLLDGEEAIRSTDAWTVMRFNEALTTAINN